MRNVQIVLFDGFDLLDAIAPYEVFCAAGASAGGTLNVEFVTAEGARAVASGTNGLKIEAGGRLDPERGGIILVPGASGDVEGDGPDSVPAILGRAMNTELTGLMSRAIGQKDTVVATVCGGSLLLAMGGLLEGRRAVTHHLGMKVLGATGAVPVPARVVDDGSLVTGGGVTSGLDVALYLVERELGPRIAHAVEQLFEYERRGTVWRESGAAPTAREVPGADGAERDAARLGGGKAPSSAFDGIWETTIATPIGKLPVQFRFYTEEGKLRGWASNGEEEVPLADLEIRDHVLTWSQRVTKPMRLNLKFEAAIDGDRMTGIAKAGVLPASKVTGARVR
ncbi:DJ-1/PfpI family protein [Cohnella zeiphila]|uniref:DJ-1/PfpI family protein n=1 Tax=Cohnella zeiphila TaxID=2761120 RepID=A0A7X0SR38_9BACL|nr:DJ-1/PfpI family protein [Cohnella zeiphila]MBB6734615.1 DJ-1/PfpI family protein [Cohnella zeiphila]